MKERPIIFNADMVRAVLDGIKTQTRRIMRVQPDSAGFESRFIIDSTKRSEIGKWCWAEPGVFVNPRRSALFSCPFGAVGDRLWVREAWQVIHDYLDEHGNVDERRYARSIPKQRGNYWHPVYSEAWGDENKECRGFPWRPSIHMPRWASRITLEITGVRVERLQDISQEDAHAEGMELAGWRPTYSDPDSGGEVMTPYDNFAELWESIYGADSWQANPWVWVIEFKRVEVE